MFKSIKRRLFYIINQFLFCEFGKRSYIRNPMQIDGAKNICIGNKTSIGYKVWLASLPLTGNHKSILQIGNHCKIGNFNHIYATKSIILEDGVLTADKVYISDNLHGYKKHNIFIKDQEIIQNGNVIIKSGAWLGENVCIIGASVGKNSVIGANSVVTKDIPDYCVAVGAPAKIIKRYCFDRKDWFSTNVDGSFK